MADALQEYLASIGITDEDLALVGPDEIVALAFLAGLFPERERLSVEEVAARIDSTPEVVRRVWRAAGFPDPPPDEPALVVAGFMTHPQQDLLIDDAPTAPRDWLLAGGDPVPVCRLAELEVERGVTALVHGQAIAIFRTQDDHIYALGNHDLGRYCQTRGLGSMPLQAVRAEPAEVLYK